MANPPLGFARMPAPSVGWLFEGGTLQTTFSTLAEQNVAAARPFGWARGGVSNDRHGASRPAAGRGGLGGDRSRLLEEDTRGRSAGDAQAHFEGGEIGSRREAPPDALSDERRGGGEEAAAAGAVDDAKAQNFWEARRAEKQATSPVETTAAEQHGAHITHIASHDKKRAGPPVEWVPAAKKVGRPPKAERREVYPGDDVTALRERIESLEKQLDVKTKQLESERRDAANSHRFAQDLVKQLDDNQVYARRLRDERNDAERRERQAVEGARAAAARLEEVKATIEAQLTEAREVARALHATLLQMQAAGTPMAMAVQPQAMQQYVPVAQPGAAPQAYTALPSERWSQGAAPHTHTPR